MKAVGIICELNPMHQGHKALFDFAKSQGEALVCAMSGPFVQRGEPAFIDKWRRAQIAVEEGADLVVEIPSYFVLQSADFFALGGLSTLALLPSVQALALGVEADYIDRLADLRKGQKDREGQIQAGLAAGLSLKRALNQSLGLDLPPNTTLALAYLEALDQLGLDWELRPLARASAHHGAKLDPTQPTGKALRQAIRAWQASGGDKQAREGMEPASGGTSGGQIRAALCGSEAQRTYILTHGQEGLDPLLGALQVQTITRSLNWTTSPSFEPGMDQRFVQALQTASAAGEGVEGACQRAANKRQSVSRYRRLVLSTLLGMEKGAYPQASYLRVLAMNARGARLLREVEAPIIQKASRAHLAGDQQLFIWDQEAQALHAFLNGFPPEEEYAQRFMVP